MVEFDETLTRKYEGKSAYSQRALARLKVRKGEIPFFPRGLDIQEFSFDNPESSIRDLLYDLSTSIVFQRDRIYLIDINVEIPVSVWRG